MTWPNLKDFSDGWYRCRQVLNLERPVGLVVIGIEVDVIVDSGMVQSTVCGTQWERPGTELSSDGCLVWHTPDKDLRSLSLLLELGLSARLP